VGCAAPPKKEVYNARIYTIDNDEIDVVNLHLWEKKFQFSSEAFNPRWRGSLEKVDLPFGELASAVKVDDNLTQVNFRDGRSDLFNEFFEDEYNLRGYSIYGPFEINATLVRGVVFLDENGEPVSRETVAISPIIPPVEHTDRFVTFDGDIVSGKLAGKTIDILTSYGKVTIDYRLIFEIRVNREQDDIKEVVQLKNGDIVSGYIDPPRFKMELAGGQEITMGADKLNRVLFGRPVATEDVEKR
nr:hypothetical protein [bacterium]